MRYACCKLCLFEQAICIISVRDEPVLFVHSELSEKGLQPCHLFSYKSRKAAEPTTHLTNIELCKDHELQARKEVSGRRYQPLRPGLDLQSQLQDTKNFLQRTFKSCKTAKILWFQITENCSLHSACNLATVSQLHVLKTLVCN